MSIRLSTWNNSVPPLDGVSWNFTVVGGWFLKSFEKFLVWLKSDKNDGPCMWRPTYMYGYFCCWRFRWCHRHWSVVIDMNLTFCFLQFPLCKIKGNNLLACILTYVVTYSVEQSPFWKGDWLLASQEIPCILWKPNVHYRVRRCRPPVRILNQLDLVHALTSIPLPEDPS